MRDDATDSRDSSDGDDAAPEADDAVGVDADSADAEVDADSADAEVDAGDDEMDRLLAEFDALEETVDSPAERKRVRAARSAALSAANDSAVFGRVIRGFDRGDLAEAFLGCVLFGIPMFVEGGTNEVGHFLAANPISLVGTVLAAVGLVVGILYVADIQDVRVHDPIFGIIPRRLVGVFGVSFLTALVVMTAWGRVEWSAPLLALGDVVVAFVPMSIGAALGDILPGS